MSAEVNPRKTRRPNREGAALLVVIFVVFMVSSLTLNMLDTETQQSAIAHNVSDYERALYLANAGVHHACALLVQDDTWRGTVADGAYPLNNTYQAAAANGEPGQVVITSVGVAGEAQRTVVATIEM